MSNTTFADPCCSEAAQGVHRPTKNMSISLENSDRDEWLRYQNAIEPSSRKTCFGLELSVTVSVPLLTKSNHRLDLSPSRARFPFFSCRAQGYGRCAPTNGVTLLKWFTPLNMRDTYANIVVGKRSCWQAQHGAVPSVGPFSPRSYTWVSIAGNYMVNWTQMKHVDGGLKCPQAAYPLPRQGANPGSVNDITSLLSCSLPTIRLGLWTCMDYHILPAFLFLSPESWSLCVDRDLCPGNGICLDRRVP